MNRTPDGRPTCHAHRRPQLLAALTEYVLDRGMGDVALVVVSGWS